MPSSSQASSSSSTLKRKQQSISSFFAKKTPAAQKSSSDGAQPQETGHRNRDTVEEAAHVRNNEQSSDNEDQDIVVPAPKRTRTNGLPSRNISADPSSPVSCSFNVEEAAPSTSSQWTDRFRFATSPALDDDFPAENLQDGEEKLRQQKERERLHKRFVKKLGGPDCLIGIGSNSHGAGEAGIAEDGADAVEGADEDEGPAQHPPLNGRGKALTKKGGSKLTPMERQVIDIKRKHMDTILVVEVGYKFRFFGEDARVAAKELSIVCIPGKLRFDERMEGPY